MAVSFGVLARDAGLSSVATIVMSVIVFAGSAQFAAVTILAAGGGAGAAVVAAALMNSRFLPMGVALAPSLPGGPLARGAQGQTVVDASWALAIREDGTFDRWHLFGASAIQYVTWVTGTVAGTLGGDALGDVRALGLDAIYPAFFLALLIGEARSRRARGAAALGALIALALVPVRTAGRAGARGQSRRADRAAVGRRPAGPGARRPVRRRRGLDRAAGMSTAVIVVGGCAVVTAAIKAAGPVALGGRALPVRLTGMIAVLAPALLAALVVTQTLAEGRTLSVGPETVGVAAGGLVMLRSRSIVACVVVAAVVTAGLRAL